MLSSVSSLAAQCVCETNVFPNACGDIKRFAEIKLKKKQSFYCNLNIVQSNIFAVLSMKLNLKMCLT